MNELIPKCENALSTVDKYFDAAVEQVKKSVIIDGKLSKEILAEKQHASHGLAWIATYRATLKEMVESNMKNLFLTVSLRPIDKVRLIPPVTMFLTNG